MDQFQRDAEHQSAVDSANQKQAEKTGTPRDYAQLQTKDGRDVTFVGHSVDPNASGTELDDGQLIRIGNFEMTLGEAKRFGIINVGPNQAPDQQAEDQGPKPAEDSRATDQPEEFGDLAFAQEAAEEMLSFEASLGEHVAAAMLVDAAEGRQLDDAAIADLKRAGQGDPARGYEAMVKTIDHANSAFANALDWDVETLKDAVSQLQYADDRTRAEYRQVVGEMIKSRGSAKATKAAVSFFKSAFEPA